MGINFTNLVSVCTGGAPVMIGKNEGLLHTSKKNSLVKMMLFFFHCILHQQNLCAQSAVLDDTLRTVIGIVNFIRANAMRHRQFRQMLTEDDEIVSVDLPYHAKVRWLSQGQVLIRIMDLREKIIEFYHQKNQTCKLSNVNFLQNVAFLCDIMSKQNELNISLQGKNKSVYEAWQKIQAFRKKLIFLKSLLAKSNFSENHFPQLAKILSECAEDITSESKALQERYLTVIDSLINQYNARFQDFEKHEASFKLAFQPHLLEFSEAPEEFQMELIELSEDNILKSQFNNKEDPSKIWKNAIEYPRLREHARR